MSEPPSPLSTGLLAAVRNAAVGVPPGHARKLAEVLGRYDTPSSAMRMEALSIAPVPLYRRSATTLLDAWAAEPGVPGPLLAAALSGAVETAEALRAAQALDVVWTGPATAEVPVRFTREVLLELIAGAARSLIVVSFAAYKVPDIVRALDEAAGRGVDVRLVLESSVASGGRLTFDAAGAFRDLAGRVRFYEWPTSQRMVESGPPGSMHAKAVIADEQTVLVTSANLTGSAIEANMELGLLVRGGQVPQRLARHFRALVASGRLAEVGA
jgi:cardiolipin synthase A/B